MAGGEKISSQSISVGGTGFSDYQLNIRALDDGDKAHQSLPYTFDTWEFEDTLITNGTSEDNDMPVENTNDRYVVSVELIFIDSSEFMDLHNEGIIIELKRVSGSTHYIWRETISGDEMQPVYDGSNFKLTIVIHPKFAFRLPAGDTFRVTYENHTGNTIDTVDGIVQYMEPALS